ncbi:ferrochelatase [Pseudoruegeria sp. HB172150]|uniref:ferrochelatase n=1 Tax=Pseudoruegeria sp. HB172150 TaxID=2721164 RepID=UPI0015581F7E|nr:ferrochelatase [Pseudoruegeria sp. HB172150]
MKKVALAAVIAATASSAFAGAYGEAVVVEPEVVVEEASATSSHDLIVPLMVLAIIAAAVAD